MKNISRERFAPVNDSLPSIWGMYGRSSVPIALTTTGASRKKVSLVTVFLNSQIHSDRFSSQARLVQMVLKRQRGRIPNFSAAEKK